MAADLQESDPALLDEAANESRRDCEAMGKGIDVEEDVVIWGVEMRRGHDLASCRSSPTTVPSQLLQLVCG